MLVYIATLGLPSGRYFAECELPTEPTSEMPYRIASRHEALTFDELVSLVRGHLGGLHTSRGEGH